MLEVINPATEQVLKELEPATAGDADAAVARAKAAYPKWRAVEPATAPASCTGSPTRSIRSRSTWQN